MKGPAKILIVEDEGIVAFNLQQRLQHMGYEVAGVAESGSESLSLVASERPDLVLMDIHIKGEMDGIDVAGALSDSPHGAVLDPGVADHLSRGAADAARRQEDLGHPACLLVPDSIRSPVARLLRRAAPRLRVLGHSEIPDTHSIRIGSIIGANA